VVFYLEMALISWLLARDGHSERSDLRGSGRQSVTRYVHERRELYCSSMRLPVCVSVCLEFVWSLCGVEPPLNLLPA
jgi:hypothetical protein